MKHKHKRAERKCARMEALRASYEKKLIMLRRFFDCTQDPLKRARWMGGVIKVLYEIEESSLKVWPFKYIIENGTLSNDEREEIEAIIAQIVERQRSAKTPGNVIRRRDQLPKRRSA